MEVNDSKENTKQVDQNKNCGGRRAVWLTSPVQFVEVEDGKKNTEQVDQNPDRVQHIVTVRSLRPRFRSYFLMTVIIS